MIKKHSWLIPCVMVFFCTPLGAHTKSGLQPHLHTYHASYHITLHTPLGIINGTMARNLEKTADNHYTLTQTMQGNLIANMTLKKKKLDRITATFKVDDNTVIPLRYTKGTNSKQTEISLATTTNPTIYDPYSAQSQYALDLQKNPTQTTHTYHIKDSSTNITTFSIETDSSSEATSTQCSKTIKTKMTEQGMDGAEKNRHTLFWLCPEKGYIPVKTIRYKEGKQSMEVTLTEYTEG